MTTRHPGGGKISLLVRRLELGLITVSFQTVSPGLRFYLSALDRQKNRQAGRRQLSSLKMEIEGRHANYNLGGSTGKKLMTAYKEQAIQIACCLQKYGPLAPKKLRALGTGKKTFSILYNNYYGWFERVERGIYQLSQLGEQELKEFPELVAYYYGLLEEKGTGE